MSSGKEFHDENSNGSIRRAGTGGETMRIDTRFRKIGVMAGLRESRLAVHSQAHDARRDGANQCADIYLELADELHALEQKYTKKLDKIWNQATAG